MASGRLWCVQEVSMVPPNTPPTGPTGLRIANDVRPAEPIRHGAYLCLTEAHRDQRIAAEVRALVDRLELRNESDPGDDHPPLAIAFLRRVGATPPPRPGDIADDALLATSAIVHVAAPTA